MSQVKLRTYLAKRGQTDARWFHADATDQILLRLATKIATILMGMHIPKSLLRIARLTEP